MAVHDDTGYSFYGRRESSWFIQNVFAFTSEYVHNTEPWSSQHAKNTHKKTAYKKHGSDLKAEVRDVRCNDIRRVGTESLMPFSQTRLLTMVEVCGNPPEDVCGIHINGN